MFWNIQRSTRFVDLIQKIFKKFKHYVRCILNNRQAKQSEIVERQRIMFDAQTALINQQAEHLKQAVGMIEAQKLELSQVGANLKEMEIKLESQSKEIEFRLGSQLHEMEIRIGSQLQDMEIRQDQSFMENKLIKLMPRLRRNLLPNDSSAVQKALIAMWRNNRKSILGYQDLLESGFRVFSQNDEDGILLRIFSHIGQRNKFVVEIGSNCADSDIGIPENLSANLVTNHGWHGLIFETDQAECDKMRYFFARDFATKHFHMLKNKKHDYFSPVIVQNTICPENINKVLKDKTDETEPDLMVIDIDGGDYAVIRSMEEIQPRVLVVEFEKRFRDRHSVVQLDSSEFSKRWPQSGAASLPAWEKLLKSRGYVLCAIGTCGFNAFFVRSDVASSKLNAITSSEAFDGHPILSKVSEDFWLLPDETWHEN